MISVHSKVLLATLTLGFAAAPLAAQATFEDRSPPPTPATGPELAAQRAPIHTAAGDSGFDYGIWAAGADYKASFHDGMTFVPYLGQDYPQNQPWSWCTVSARIGEVELAVGTPEPARQEFRYEYRFGGITEAYDVRGEGLEQTFVIAERPAAGDLVIVGRVTTALRSPAVAAAHQPLVFSDDRGQAIASYGAAVAVDATGKRMPMTTEFCDGEITLCLAGRRLADAVLPIVVDPLLSNVQISTGNAYGQSEIGRDDEAATVNVMMAYVRWASISDGDVYARLMNDDFSASVTVFTDITANWSTDNACCAFVGGVNRWVVGMARGFATTPITRRIRAHVHRAADPTLLTNIAALAVTANVNDWHVDVGGVDSFHGGDKAIFVFQCNDDGAGANINNSRGFVRGAIFDPSNGAQGTFGQPFDIVRNPNQQNLRPRVNQAATGSGSWSWICATWSYDYSISGDDADVIAKRIDNTGAVATGTWRSALGSQNTHHQISPVVEGSGGRYLIAFATAPLAMYPNYLFGVTGTAIRTERFDWAEGAAAPSAGKPPVTIANANDLRWVVSGIAFDTDDESHWVVTTRSARGFGTGAAYYNRIGFNGATTETGVVYFQSPYAAYNIDCVYDNDADAVLFSYATDAPGNPLYGRTLTYDQPATPALSGQACSNATIAWVGNQQIGAEFNRIQVDNQGVAAGHFLLVSLTTTDFPLLYPGVAPGCRLLVPAGGPYYLATLPFQYGATVSWEIALPEWLDPMTLCFQDWLFDGQLIRGTRALSVPLAK
ncbi:MAG: hypothetical protein KDE27_23475 [Planctomycetes bacterium]|nr:hypothetical protein [Planctomycetota bacterium]